MNNFGLGTFSFGLSTPEIECHSILDFALANNINTFDSAELYVHNNIFAEQILGNWVRYNDRDKIVINTKIAGPGKKPSQLLGRESSITQSQILSSLDNSLNRLNTNYIDTYFIHWPERYLPKFGAWQYDRSVATDYLKIEENIFETLDTLTKCQKEGKIKQIGLSNESAWGVMTFLRISEKFKLSKISIVQNQYNLLNRMFDITLDETCFLEGIHFQGYSPLAWGQLTESAVSNCRMPFRLKFFKTYNRYQKENVKHAIEHYLAIANRNNISLEHLALSWIQHRQNENSFLIGTSSLGQFKVLYRLLSNPIPLEHEMSAIDEIFLRYTNIEF